VRADRSASSGRLPLRPYPPSHPVSLQVAVVEKRSTNYLGQKADRSGSGRVSPSAPCAELRRVRTEENQAHSLLTRALVVSNRPFPIR
jgi:hypothetical protein